MGAPKKILVLLGHPDKETLNGALADAYQRGAEEAGHEVRRINISDLSFDPILHKGYKEVQELEPDLVGVQEDIKWADHLVIFYPTWWGSMPALLSGLFERIILPRFGFKYKNHLFWNKLLRGRSARIVTTLDVPLLFRWHLPGDTKIVKKTILHFCGFSPVRITRITPVKMMPEKRIKTWLIAMNEFGRQGR